MQYSWTDARDALCYVHAQYAEFSNGTRSFTQFSLRDLVLLKRNSLKKHPKLEPILSGRYKVLAKTSNVTYRLKLQPRKRFRPLVYVRLLKAYLTCSTPQVNEDEGKTPDPLSHVLSALDLANEPVYPPKLSEFQKSESILKEKDFPT